MSTARSIERIERELSGSHFAAPRRPHVSPRSLVDARDPTLRHEILQLIVGYLQAEGYTASMLTVCDEANVRLNEHVARTARVKRIKKAALDGEWVEFEKLCTRQTFRNYRTLLYAAYKQEYLVHICVLFYCQFSYFFLSQYVFILYYVINY